MEYDTEIFCPVSTTLKLIGGKYKPLILWHLVDSTLRFSQLQKIITGATPKMLTQQLRELEKDNLINRKIYPVVPPKVEYSLTALGETLIPVLDMMYKWGNNYLNKQGKCSNCTMHKHKDTTQL